MLNSLLNWGRNQLQSLRARPSNSTAPQQASNLSREQRADLVTRLRADINRIQHEISDLSDTMPADGAASSADTSRMAELHRQLAKTQQELSRYQARI
jgi:ABC-type transport system involved in cytochrome bd biosynthesis fused ATPase/permease subunit